MASPVLQDIVAELSERPPYHTLDVAGLRRGLEALAGRYPPPREARHEPVSAGGVPAEWVDMPESGPERVVCYLHGGAYLRGSPVSHRGLAARLARSAGARLLVVDYRLAPEHPFPAAVNDAVAVLRWLAAQGVAPERLAVAGDSAGGGLAVAALTELRQAGAPLPAAGALLSPWTDLAVTGATVDSNAGADPMVGREYLLDMAGRYLAGADPRHPLASPLYAALHGLPPLLIQVGGAEVLQDDAARLARRVREAGGEAQLETWPEMIHGWHLFAPRLPEAERAVAALGDFLRRRLA